MMQLQELEAENDQIQEKTKHYKILSHKIKLTNIDSITFNKNHTVLFLGEDIQGIKIFGFNNKFKIIQAIISPKSNWCYYILFFIKKFNQLVSAGGDFIIVWKQDKNNQWKPDQILQEHQSQIVSLIINKGDDLLISGSENEEIIFWKKMNSCWNIYQTIQIQIMPTCLTLNISNDKLVTCQYSKNIIKCLECQSNLKWVIAQTIEINETGLELAFINNNQFMNLNRSEFFLIYQFDDNLNQFIINKQVQLQKCEQFCDYATFIQFVEQKNILFFMYHCQDYLFLIDSSGEFGLKQIVQYDHTYSVISQLTSDGEYVATWVQAKHAILIRKLQKMK